MASWFEGAWALDCLWAGPPIIATNTWRVLLFGIIPLRPVQIVMTIDRSLPVEGPSREGR